ncbi:MAG: multidrug efflux RND transporter permease subunit [Patescibacteria group bacterium]|nr:multidrug efflux RND transporter permease subunit [Patescibacteria group bacterium]
MSRFFIERPIFATVISLVIVLIGGIAGWQLPVEQTPDITPPTVVVSTSFPGASPEVVADTVGVPIEQEVNGVENMIYMSSQCTDDGGYSLTITFEVGTDVDMATVLVQNRVNIATPKLPDEVKRQGVKTDKRSTNMVLMVNMISPDRRYDEIYLSNYVGTQIKDVLSRVPGVGSVQVMGAKDFGMRLWLDPNRLRSMQLTVNDVVRAIQEQNVQVAAGQIGAPPSPPGQQFQYTVNTLGRLSDPEQFAEMIVKVGEEGRLVRVGDVARVELGAQAYNWSVELDGAPSIALAIYQLPGGNALHIADGIRSQMDALKRNFPEGLDYTIVYDLTTFVRASIEEVVITLLVAVALVIFTVYVFLQDIRTTFIPAVTIPVSLIGTFAVMLALGMSINTLSLFGLVLVIGIVVDDAIVVVENTKRILDEEGLSPKEATLKSMRQVTGPVIATTLVLLAVFVPTAMMGGITGRLYRQFALTIATATLFSSVNALTLSPALCAVLLRPSGRSQSWFFRGFNRAFDWGTSGYMAVVRCIARRVAIPLVAFAGIAGASLWLLDRVPGGFLPDEDQGYFIVNIELPDAATLERTQKVVDRINQRLAETPGVAHVISISGYTALDALLKTNCGALFVILEPWEDRKEASLQIESILGELQMELLAVQEAICFAFPPPPIQGLGNAAGFELRLQDRENIGLAALQEAGEELVLAGYQNPILARMNSNFRATVPQLYADVDRVEARKLGIALPDIFATLQAYLGSAYVNDFNKFGRTFKVQIQADAQFRGSVADIARLDVRNADGRMIPLETVVNVVDRAGPTAIFRYNMYPSTTVTGQPAPGFASGQAIAAVEQLAATLPPAIGYEWSGVTYQQIEAGNMAPLIFGLAIVFVYFFLAAQYESWTTPLSVMLSVPLAVFGAALAIWLLGYDNNVYTQIGLVLLIGLSAKSAILIVEFAKQRREEGMGIAEAAIEASHLRFRAILMTAFSFILGVIPLVIATGAGAASRRALGTAVFGGMLAGTILGVFFIPVLYVVVQRATEWVWRSKSE